MAWQLIFTSAVAGLNPGSSGYCTVARSASMREAVAARLEQWSVYTHAAKGSNPVICAHRILNLRGSIFHVLTRIVDSGLDYTGRTNFLAHHLVIQPYEVHGACSPAEVFLNWTGWQKVWQGQPRFVDDADFALHALPRTTRMPAKTWADLTDDAGTAACLLIENADNSAARSTDLVVFPGSEARLLNLYAETLHLLDPDGENSPAVWAIPFTTFLQQENDPNDFRWRGLSPQDQGRATGDLLCDFANGALPQVLTGTLTDYARTGMRNTITVPDESVREFSSEMVAPRRAALTSNNLTGFKHRRPATRSPASPPRSRVRPALVPRWVWITLLCVIPVGLIVWWAIGKQLNRKAIIATQPTPTPTTQSMCPVVEEAEKQPRAPVMPLADVRPITSSGIKNIKPLLDTKTNPPPNSAKEEQAFLQEKIAAELAKLPMSPTYFSVGSVREMKIPQGDGGPLQELLRRVAPPDNLKVKVELHYESMRGSNEGAGEILESIYDEDSHRIKLLDEPSYEFSMDGISTRSDIKYPFISIVIKPTMGQFQALHFFLAKDKETFSQNCFHLPQDVFLDKSGLPNFLQINSAALMSLKRLLNSWSCLQSWNNADSQQINVILKATFKMSQPGIKSQTFCSDSDLRINIENSYADAKQSLENIDGELKQIKKSIEEVQKKKSLIDASREKLGQFSFPESVHQLLSDVRFKPTMMETGKEYYILIKDWFKEIGGDTFVSPFDFPPVPPKERYHYIKDFLLKAKEKANKSGPTAGNPKKGRNAPTTADNILMLITAMKDLLKDDDLLFFEQDIFDPFGDNLNSLRQTLKAAQDERASLIARTAVVTAVDSAWLEVHIDGRPVHLIDFVEKTNDHDEAARVKQ